jgi:hypothetical protein
VIKERENVLEHLSPAPREEVIVPMHNCGSDMYPVVTTDDAGQTMTKCSADMEDGPLGYLGHSAILKVQNDSMDQMAAYPNRSWSDVGKLHYFTHVKQSIVMRSPPQCTWDCWKNNVVRGFKKCPKKLSRWSERPQCKENDNTPLLSGSGMNQTQGQGATLRRLSHPQGNASANASNGSLVAGCPVLNKTRDYMPDEICWEDEGDLEYLDTKDYELTVSRIRFRNAPWKPAALFKSLVTMGYDACPKPGDYDKDRLDPDFTLPYELTEKEREIKIWEEQLHNLTNYTEEYMRENHVGRYAPPLVNLSNCTELGLIHGIDLRNIDNRNQMDLDGFGRKI